MRRLGVLPSGMPNGLGEDERILGTIIEQEIIVYFPDTAGALHQLEQWYAALRHLNRYHKVLFVLQDSKTAARVRRDSRLPAVTIAHYGTLDDVLGRSNVRMALYVNHNPLNFSMLRFTSLVHVSLFHGDSEETVSVSNQIKAYDFSFVPGQAAIDRLSKHTELYDVQRCIPIGGASFDAEQLERGLPSFSGDAFNEQSERPTVLYTPSWENVQEAASFSVIETLGCQVLGSLLAAGRFRVIYRSHHPGEGKFSSLVRADAKCREMLKAATKSEPIAGHRLDVGVPPSSSFDDADLLICDISGVPMEWLSNGRPIIAIVPPPSSGVKFVVTPLAALLPRIHLKDLTSVPQIVDEHLGSDPKRSAREDLTTYCLGDTSPGASMQRFLRACDYVLERREAEWDRVKRNGAVGP